MYENEFKRIVEASQNNALTFFVGAGVSAISGAPTWKELIDVICDKMNQVRKVQYSSDDCLQIPQTFFYSLNDKSEYYKTIKDVIDDSNLKPNEIHLNMLRLNPISFITTNFDSLIEDAALERCKSYKVISRDNDIPMLFGDRFVLKIHGDLKHKEFVLKEEDYLSYSDNYKMIETFAKSIFATNTVVFIGYGLNDYNIKLILNWTKKLLGSKFKKPIFLYADIEDLSEKEKYLQSKGLSVIDCNRISESTDYLGKYQSFFDSIFAFSGLSMDGKSEDDSFDILYQLLAPLNRLKALRVEDVTRKVSSHIRISNNGVIHYNDSNNLLFKKFFAINRMSDDGKAGVSDKTILKYNCILSVLQKARILFVDTGNSIDRFINEELPFADQNCLLFDYKAMISFIRKEYKTLEKNYQKAFYLSRIKHYDEALILFNDIARKAFKKKDFLLYYLSASNCIMIKTVIKHYKVYGCYSDIILDSYVPNEDEVETLFNGLPVAFRKQYDSLSNLHDINMLYKHSYNAFIAGQKLKKTIESETIEFGFTSIEGVICEINNYLHFLLGNGIVADAFTEYISTVKNLMSLIVEKYASQNKKSLDAVIPSSIRNDQSITLDEVDFYCLVTSFTDKEIYALLQKHSLETIEFNNLNQIIHAIENLIDCYENDYTIFKYGMDLFDYEKRIKNCLVLLRYIDVPQSLVDKVCSFILAHEFREIHIDDKVVFLDYQLYRRGKYSETTAKAIETALVGYLDKHIESLRIGKSISIPSSRSGINYYNLMHYIYPKGERFVSQKLSKRIRLIITSGLTDLMPHVTCHFFDYLSVYQKRTIVTMIKRKIAEGFSFELLTMLVVCHAKISSSVQDQLKLFLQKKINEAITTNNNSVRIIIPAKDPYDELNQVGFWCFYNILPAKEYYEFLGKSALFDFYCLFSDFDFKRFNVAWLIGLHDETLERIAKNKKVKAYIRGIIKTIMIDTNLAEADYRRLSEILIKHFC